MLSFWRRPSQQTSPSRRSDEDDRLSLPIEAEPQDRVTYASKSDKVKFACNLPANSRHLAEAQSLSLSIFSGREARSKAIEDDQAERRSPKLLTDRNAVGQSNALEARSSKDRIIDFPPVVAKTAPGESPPSKQNSIIRKLSQRSRHSPPTSPRASKAETQKVDRASTSAPTIDRHSARTISGHKHTSATHETYVLKNGRGRSLLAAAPIGSQIASAHDKIAAQGTLPKEVRTVCQCRVKHLTDKSAEGHQGWRGR